MKNNLARRLLFTIFAAAIWLSNGGAAFADQVPIKSAARPGYGRLVFNWPTPVPFTAKISSSRLVMQFGRPIEANYSGAIRSLSKYISGAQPSVDGRTVSFVLKKEFGLRSFDSGAAIVVDLLDEVPKSKKATQAKQKAPKAQQPSPVRASSKSGDPLVKVRKGQHAKYSRIVFDWPRKVEYKFSQSGQTATISFLSPANINLGAVGQRPPKFVENISVGSGNNGPIVTLKIPGASRVKHFLVGSKIVVDIFAPGTRKAGPNPASQSATASPAPVKKVVLKVPSKPLKKEIKVAKKEARKPTNLADKPEPAAKKITGGSSSKATGAEVAGKPFSLTPGKGVTITKGAQPGNSNSSVGPTTAQGRAAGAIAAATQLKGTAGAVLLKFNWEESVAAAVFPRAGALWIVFDRKSKSLNIDALRAAGGNAIRSINLIPSENGTVLRLVTVSGINPTLKRDGLTWIFDFKKQNLQLNKAIDAKAQPNSPTGARIFLPVQEPGDPVIVTDPEVGDNLVVIPVVPLGNGVVKRYMYPQLQILPSSQGVVIRPWVDNIRVRSIRQGIEISSPGQLIISSVSKAAAAGAKSSSLRALTRLLDFKRWRNVTTKAFTQDRRKLQFDITRKKGLKREDARLELAKFYMANGFGAEVMGIMRVIEKDRPAVKDDPEFRLIRGIGSYMLGRFSDAKTDVYHKSIEKYDEGKFWQSVVDGKMGGRAQASLNLRRFGGITRPYPAALKYPLSLLIAEAAIDVGDVRIAKMFLDVVEAEEKLGPSLKGQLSFTKGRFLELSGDFENAVGEWEEAMESKHGPSRARATVARAELLLKLQNISRGETIDELETLRFAWRGDEFEFNLLRRLGRLYMEDGNFRNGLLTLKQAATHFREVQKAKEVTQEMTDAFSELYLNSAADSLPPVTAIALYDEFKELTPVGARGDEMIRKLADRLVGIDLLDDGARLLEEQVKFRLKGEERARVAARLAVVHLMNHDFIKARDVLNSTNKANLSPPLVEERRHLRARALMGMKLDGAALKLLKADKSITANLLRIEIFWNSKNWSNASRVLRKLLRQMKAKPDEPLTDEQGRYVLNLAISNTLSGNERATSRIRRDFGSAMNVTSYGDAFRLIATPQTGALIDYRTISNKVKDAELFTTFMAAYKERLKQGSLSGIN
jgi:hypothetical protein